MKTAEVEEVIRELKFHHRREMLPFLTREYPKGISRVILLRLTKYKCVTCSCVGEVRLAPNSPDIKTTLLPNCRLSVEKWPCRL